MLNLRSSYHSNSTHGYGLPLSTSATLGLASSHTMSHTAKSCFLQNASSLNAVKTSRISPQIWPPPSSTTSLPDPHSSHFPRSMLPLTNQLNPVALSSKRSPPPCSPYWELAASLGGCRRFMVAAPVRLLLPTALVTYYSALSSSAFRPLSPNQPDWPSPEMGRPGPRSNSRPTVLQRRSKMEPVEPNWWAN